MLLCYTADDGVDDNNNHRHYDQEDGNLFQSLSTVIQCYVMRHTRVVHTSRWCHKVFLGRQTDWQAVSQSGSHFIRLGIPPDNLYVLWVFQFRLFEPLDTLKPTYHTDVVQTSELNWAELIESSANVPEIRIRLTHKPKLARPKKTQKKSVGPEDSLKQTENVFSLVKKAFSSSEAYVAAINYCCPIGWDFPLWVMNICAFEKSSALYDFSIWVFLLIGLFHLLLLAEFQFGLRLKCNASMRLYPHQLWGDDGKPWLIPILWSSVCLHSANNDGGNYTLFFRSRGYI